RNFLGGRLSMTVYEDELGSLPEPPDVGQRIVKWIVQRGHEGATLQIDDGDRRRNVRLKTNAALAWGSGRIIQGPNKPSLIGEQLGDFFLVPEMIAAGHDVHASREDVFGGFRSNARAAGGILAIGHHEVDS